MASCCSRLTSSIAVFFEKAASTISNFFGTNKLITYHKDAPCKGSTEPLPVDIQRLILSYLPKDGFKKDLETYLKSPSPKRKENLAWLYKTLPQMDASAINFYPKRLCLKPSHRIKKAHLGCSLYCNFPHHHKQLTSPLYELAQHITDLDLSFSHLTNDDFEKLVEKTSSLFSLKLYCSTYIDSHNIQSLLKQNPQLSTLDIAGLPIDFKEIKSQTVRRLNISGNPCITDELLPIIAQNIPNITHLGLSAIPQLTDECAPSFTSFSNLFSLNISNNQQLTPRFFSTPFPLAKQIKELAIGNFRTTKYTKNELKLWLKDFCELRELTIETKNLRFCNTDIAWITSNFPKLKTLHLRNIKFCTDDGFLALKQLSHLNKVEITGNILISKEAQINLHKKYPRVICVVKNSFLSLENPIE